MNYRIGISVLLLSVFSFSCTSQLAHTEKLHIENITTVGEATFVDVRQASEFETSPIRYAVNIPLSEIENNLDFFRKQKHSILYCNSGKQAGEAYGILKKNGIKNVQTAINWKKALAMQNNIFNNVIFSTEKPSTFSVKKTEKIQQIAVALGKGAVLKKHTTPVPTNLIMMKGTITFKINGEDLIFTEGVTYEIPVKVEHEVVGNDAENLFILTKEL